MIQAALQDNCGAAGMELSLIEQHIEGPSYTIRTIEALSGQEGLLHPFLILGADSLVDLRHWHRVSDVLDRASLIVVRREGIDTAMIGQAITALPHAYRHNPQTDGWIDAAGRTISYLAKGVWPVSSSVIREALRRGIAPAMLPPSVFAYIKRHHLYGWGQAA